MMAANKGYTDVADLLMHNEASLDIRDRKGGWTALHHAVRHIQISLLKSLLGSHAEVNIANDIGQTPLMMAANAGCTNVADLLIQGGARLDICDDRWPDCSTCSCI